MAFRITVYDEGKSIVSTMEVDRKLRIGSDRGCDLCLKRDGVLPFHCEINGHKMAHTLVRGPHADVRVNNEPVDGDPPTLADGAEIQIDGLTLVFKIVRQSAKRHWRTGFVSYFALVLLAMMLVFESLVMFWLPARLSSDKAWDKEQALEELVGLLDHTRAIAREIPVRAKNDEGFLRLFVLTLDNIAKYVREYKGAMTRSQVAELHDGLKRLEPYVLNWGKIRKKYVQEEKITPDDYIKNLISKAEEGADK